MGSVMSGSFFSARDGRRKMGVDRSRKARIVEGIARNRNIL
jgi:hypothetical protein